MKPLEKQELQGLADGLIVADLESIERCIQFVESDSKGIWHGRARAMMCRRFKHLALEKTDADRLLKAILGRFECGDFSEQFKDMLRLALLLDKDATNASARKLSADQPRYVRSLANWILQHHSIRHPQKKDPEVIEGVENNRGNQ